MRGLGVAESNSVSFDRVWPDLWSFLTEGNNSKSSKRRIANDSIYPIYSQLQR